MWVSDLYGLINYNLHDQILFIFIITGQTITGKFDNNNDHYDSDPL